VYARTVKNPHTGNPRGHQDHCHTRLRNSKRVFVATNHNHNFGPEHQHSFVQWEGLIGAARITMGLNLDYPTGKLDTAEYAERASDSPLALRPGYRQQLSRRFYGNHGCSSMLRGRIRFLFAVATLKTRFKPWRSLKPCTTQANFPASPLI